MPADFEPLHRDLDFIAPLDDRRATELSDFLGRRAQGTVVDLGCGWAELLIYESSPRFSVRYDQPDEVLLLSKPPTAQCFWVQRWSSDEREWLVVGAIPEDGIISPGVGERFGTKDIENPGCEDEGLEPAPLWIVPFSHAIPGIYRVVWLAEGEFSEPIEIL